MSHHFRSFQFYYTLAVAPTKPTHSVLSTSQSLRTILNSQFGANSKFDKQISIVTQKLFVTSCEGLKMPYYNPSFRNTHRYSKKKKKFFILKIFFPSHSLSTSFVTLDAYGLGELEIKLHFCHREKFSTAKKKSSLLNWEETVRTFLCSVNAFTVFLLAASSTSCSFSTLEGKLSLTPMNWMWEKENQVEKIAFFNIILPTSVSLKLCPSNLIHPSPFVPSLWMPNGVHRRDFSTGKGVLPSKLKRYPRHPKRFITSPWL